MFVVAAPPSVNRLCAEGLACRALPIVGRLAYAHPQLTQTGNLLVDDNWRVAVVDFGISRMIDLTMSKKNIGTPIYSAPEVLCGQPYSFSADVYSFAFVMWELVAREVPYKQHKQQAYIINGVCNEGLRPPEPKGCPPQLWQLIQRCWQQDPAQRPTFANVVVGLKRNLATVGSLHVLKSLDVDATKEMVKTLRAAPIADAPVSVSVVTAEPPAAATTAATPTTASKWLTLKKTPKDAK